MTRLNADFKDAGHNVFISWSGERSLSVAKALRAWLPKVLQVAKPWMSDTEIVKGSRGINEIARALEGMKVGISCLTPENLEAPWLAFEAGALSKSIDSKTRLCTNLFGGLNFQDVRPPLSMFQATRADKEYTRKLIHAINRAVQDAPISDLDLDELFDTMWPSLEKNHFAIPAPEQSVEVKRPVEDMVAEILDWARAEPQRRTELASDITSRFAANRSASGRTVDIDVLVNGKPMTVPFGVSELLRPTIIELMKPKFIELVRKHTEKAVEQEIEASSMFDAIRGVPEFPKFVKESIGRKIEEKMEEIDRTIEEAADAAFEAEKQAVKRELNEHSISVDVNEIGRASC